MVVGVDKRNNRGFTLIEVMVALAIVGISLGVFVSILGNSMKMRGKLEDHARMINVARVKAEELELGLIEDVTEGETEDGIYWEMVPVKVEARVKMAKEGEDERTPSFEKVSFEDDTSSKKMDFYNVIVGGIEITSNVRGR